MQIYQQIVQNIIRPTRQKYRINRLGPKNFNIKSKINGTDLIVQRQDSVILNKYNKKLHLSHYNILNRQNISVPCVIYLHANNGSRNQGVCYVDQMLQNQITIMLFDCSGSGVSQGDYITLGVKESEDLEYVIEYLIKYKNVRDIGLWGRSMGAVTSLIYASKNIRQLKGCIFDSPFCCLKRLIKQLGNKRTGIPEFLFNFILPKIETQLKQKVGINYQNLNIPSLVPYIRCPGFFITSKKDNLVDYEHTQQIFKTYRAQKIIEFIQCEHHENRPKKTITKAIEFLKEKFRSKKPQGLNIFPINKVNHDIKILTQQSKSDRLANFIIQGQEDCGKNGQKNLYLCFFENTCIKQDFKQAEYTIDTSVKRPSIQSPKKQYNSTEPRYSNLTKFQQKLIKRQKCQQSLPYNEKYQRKQSIPVYFDKDKIGIRKLVLMRKDR